MRYTVLADIRGMGYSDPPGYFFWITLGSATTSAAGLIAYRFGIHFGLILAFGFGLVALIAVWGIPVGILDQRVYDGPKCPSCGHRVERLWPWSM